MIRMVFSCAILGRLGIATFLHLKRKGGWSMPCEDDVYTKCDTRRTAILRAAKDTTRTNYYGNSIYVKERARPARPAGRHLRKGETAILEKINLLF